MLPTTPIRLLIGACFATCVAAADDGDDFSNNLFTDLAPLLALFGERVTTQFMSQSTGWADNIILAMVLLGIITAVVGAIRVGGPSWLKAIIGRARENRAVAESELMSSTSREVCELWNGREIVRVMGEGPIREFIILSPDGNGDGRGKANAPATAQTQTATGGTERGSDSSQVTGSETDEKTFVMDLERAKNEKHLTDYNLTFRERITGRLTEKGQEVHRPILLPVRAYIRRIFRRRVHQGQDLEDPGDCDTHETPSDSNSEKPDPGPSSVVVIRNTGVHTPNLTLNIHNRVFRGDLYFVAALGLLIQLGVLVYYGIAAKYLTRTLLKDEKLVADYAFPCIVAGTLLLVTGMLLCSHVVESSTSETRYRPVDGMKARVIWLQRSGTVNDQAFESFAIFPSDTQALITTSQQAPRRRLKALKLLRGERGSQGTKEAEETTPKQKRFLEVEVEEIIAVIGTMFSICGYIMQFTGLRGMHWSASVAQLGAIVVMAILRAWVRRNLAKNPKSQPLLSGHEMDWLAMALEDSMKAPWRDPSKRDGKAWEWKIVLIEDPANCEALKPQLDPAATNNTDGSTKSQTSDNGSHRGSDADLENQSQRTNSLSRAHSGIQSQSTNSLSRSHSEIQSQRTNSLSRSHAVMMIRRDLGELADWHGPASAEAIALARAIEITLDTLDDLIDPVGGKLTWSLPAVKPFDASSREPIAFRVERQEDGNWTAYSDEIDAALSLWLYSVHERENGLRDNAEQSKEKGGDDESSTRQQAAGGEESPNARPLRSKGDKWLRAKGTPAKRSLRLLGSSHTAALLRDLQWWMPGGASKVIEVHRSESNVDGGIMEVDPHRVVGFAEPSSCSPAEPHAYLYERKPLEPPHEGAPLAVKSYSPLKALYAQHMFSAFLWAVAKAMQPLSNKADIRPTETDGPLTWQSFTLHDSQLSRMAQDIQSTGLGGLEDVFLSIIPPLSAKKKLPRADAIIDLARKYAKPHEQQGHWDEAANAYLWLFHKAKTFPKEGDIATKATALLMEHLRAVSDAIELRKAQQFEERDIQALEQVKEKLEKELQSAGDDILSALMGLYQAQGRSWEHPLVENPEVLEGENSMLKFTGLHWKARDNNAYGMERWVEKRKGDINDKDILDWTPLHYAAAKPSHIVLQTLLKYQVDVNARDIRGRTPLHYACQHDDTSIVQDLLRKGAEINTGDVDGTAPLHIAAIEGGINVMRSLIEAGADIDIVDSLGNTPLYQAAYKGRKAQVELLEDANIKLRDHNGRTALHLATMAKEPTAVEKKEVVGVLIGRKTDIEAKDRSSFTALHYAARNGHFDIVKYLIEQGANIEAGKYLIEQSANKEAEDRRFRTIGTTPLHLAAENGHFDIVKYLIEQGANKEAKDRSSRTPLDVAVENGQMTVAQLLRSKP